ncbi:hypothetical protein GCM10011341_18490 [Frigidibacter albus]|nr:hypothetical protein GCM10011341_18490 [Frigidibacter albus]
MTTGSETGTAATHSTSPTPQSDSGSAASTVRGARTLPNSKINTTATAVIPAPIATAKAVKVSDWFSESPVFASPIPEGKPS